MEGERRKSNVQFLPETELTSPRWSALVLSFCEKLQFFLERTEKYIIRGKHHILFSLQLTRCWLLVLCSLGSGLEHWKCVQLGVGWGIWVVCTQHYAQVSYAHTSDSSDSHGDKLFFQYNYSKPKAVSNCIYYCELCSKSYSLWDIHFNELKMLI